MLRRWLNKVVVAYGSIGQCRVLHGDAFSCEVELLLAVWFERLELFTEPLWLSICPDISPREICIVFAEKSPEHNF